MIFFSPSPFQRRSMQSFLESAFWYVSFVIASNRLYSFWNESHWKPLTCFNSLYFTGWWLRMRSETVLPKRISIRIYSKYSEYPAHPRRWSVFSSLSEGEEADSAFSYSRVESDTRYRCSWYTRYDFDLEDHPLIKKEGDRSARGRGTVRAIRWRHVGWEVIISKYLVCSQLMLWNTHTTTTLIFKTCSRTKVFLWSLHCRHRQNWSEIARFECTYARESCIDCD